LRGSIVRLAAFCGGFVGFVAVLPFLAMAMFEVSQEWLHTAISILAGPCFATVLGQLDGAQGGAVIKRSEREVPRIVVGHRGVPIQTRAGHSNEDAQSATPFQFGVRHLLVIGVWASLLLTAIRLSGLSFRFAFVLLMGWVVYQSVTLWLVVLLTEQFGRWRIQHQSRST